MIFEKIFISKNGLLNGKKLRFSNEPVRHKTLDLLGDLALLGMSIRGHVIAIKSGHAANVELIKKIKLSYKKKIQNQNIPPNKYPRQVIKIIYILQEIAV